MADEIEVLLKRFERARQKRSNWESTYEECYEYALPSKTSFFNQSEGRERTEKIFDETAVVGVQEFASRLQAGIVPNFARWSDLVAGGEVPDEEKQGVNEALDAVTEYLFEIIQNSNFSQETNECFLDLALGTACMHVDEGDALNPLVFSAIPLPQLYLDSGPDDQIDTVFRTRQMKTSNLVAAYRRAVLPREIALAASRGEETMHTVVEGCYRVYDSDATEKYQHRVFLPKEKVLLASRDHVGEGSSPFIPFRWAKAAGEVWGRGPLFNALPAIKVCNLVVQLILENAQMAISGIYTAEDDGVVNVDTIRLIPGTVIPVAPGSNGLRAIGAPGNFDVAQLVLTDMRQNIKRALYNDMLGNPNRGTPMSATEVTERMADLSRQIGAAFGRLQAEFVTRILRRSLYILRKRGLIQLPSINGRMVKVRSTSPLAQAQAYQDIQSVDRWVELVGARLGPQLVNLFVNGDEVASYMAEKFGVPGKLLRSGEERGQLMQQLGQAMGQMNGGQTPIPGM